MAQLAEAYVHLRPHKLSERRAHELGRPLVTFAVQAAQDIFTQRVVVDVQLEEGSLRTWITVSGALLIYGAIANYKGFKEGVSEMVHDARAFSEVLYEPFVKTADASKDQIYRFERRLKTTHSEGEMNNLHSLILNLASQFQHRQGLPRNQDRELSNGIERLSSPI